MPEEAKKSFENICKELRLNFGHIDLPSEVGYPQLVAIKITLEGTVQTFYEKLNEHGKRLNISDEMLKTLFIGGLVKHVKTYVMLWRPKNLTESVELAKQAELLIPIDEGTSSYTPKKGSFWTFRT